MEQLPLQFNTSEVIRKVDLIKGAHNQEAVQFLFNSFLNSEERIALISGPSKVGKTYLTKSYINEVNGLEIFIKDINSFEKSEILASQNKVYLLENLSGLNVNEESHLFHFYNLINQSGSKLIITTNVLPKQLKISLPDLRSRILSTRVIFITEPLENEILKLIIFKMFQDRQIKVDINIINYITHSLERRLLDIFNIINKIEKEIFISKQKLNIKFVKQIVERNEQ